MTQHSLFASPEYDRCVRCGQEPVIEPWVEPVPDGEGVNVSCACRVISGERDGMAEAWNRAAARKEAHGEL